MQLPPTGCEKTITIGIDENGHKAVVNPVSPVLPPNCTIRWTCDVGVATISIPDLGSVLTASPGSPAQEENISQSCYYFVSVLDSQERRVGSMAVIIIDH